MTASAVPGAAAGSCPACGGDLAAGLRDWHRRCPRCRYEGSTLAPRILEQAEGGDLDEAARAGALAPLRHRNFRRLAALVAKHHGEGPLAGGPRPRLLDIGCAHGWFLDAVADRFDGEGVEPDAAVARATRARGVAVREGFFPAVVAADETWEVLVFNDVLEHIPDVHATLAACRRHLRPGGLLVVNAPDRRGAIYRVAKGLARAGAGGPFARLWQYGFPSPHVHYFDEASLGRITARHGFVPVARARLASLAWRGLYDRVRYGRDLPAARALATAAVAAAAVPVLALLPADIGVWVFRRGFDGTGDGH